MSDKLPRMDYRQHRRARRLVHECCNYDEGELPAAGRRGALRVRPRAFPFPSCAAGSVWLSWPLDGELAAALLYRGSRKRCAVCGAAFVPKSNRGKYCPDWRRTHEEKSKPPRESGSKGRDVTL